LEKSDAVPGKTGAGCYSWNQQNIFIGTSRVMDEQQTQGTKPPAGTAEPMANAETGRLTFWKRPPIIAAGTVLLAVLLFFALHYTAENFTHESTDDAFLTADIVSIAPKVAGHVSHVCVSDNQSVKAGDLLLEIDPQDFAVEVAQKKAALVSAESNVKLLLASLDLIGAQVATAEATARQSAAEAAADRANADKAEADLKRAEDLIQQKTISPQEYDAAKAAAASTIATWKAGQEKAASDQSKISEARAELEAGRRAWERAEAQSSQSRVDVQQADLNQSYTRLVAPQDGRITRKAVEKGDYVQIGQKLMALVPDDIWVTANFKETQLKNIRPGQPVKIEIDSAGGRRFAGRVDSIQAGSGAAFSLLPPENAVGNFVKVVQRVPVKIVFTERPDTGHVLGPGMSVVPYVRTAGFEVPDLIIAVLAVILALITGWLWRKLAARPPKA
jgi:membrane fusion protein (multidrug efflux system)